MFSITGIDPGIRDTGVVNMLFNPLERQLDIDYIVISDMTVRENGMITVKPDALEEIATFVQNHESFDVATWAFIEGYRARGNDVRQDRDMQVLIQAIRDTLPGSKVIDNTGVKKIITEEQLELFKVRRFAVPTNHSDLKSAARIGLVGGVKDDYINKMLYNFTIDQVEGRPWTLNNLQEML